MVGPPEAIFAGAAIGLAVSPAVALLLNQYNIALAEWSTNPNYRFPSRAREALRYTAIAFLSTTFGGVIGATAGLFF